MAVKKKAAASKKAAAPKPQAKQARLAVSGNNTVLIAADDGNIYQLEEARWRKQEYLLTGDAAANIKTELLDNGAVAANLPDKLVTPFFACYLINLAMIRPPPKSPRDDK